MMFKKRLGLLILAGTCLLVLEVVATAQDVMADRLEIVVRADAPKTVRFAAKELKGFMDEALEADIPVRSAVTKGKMSFLLGTDLWLSEGFSTNGWTRDAFQIRTRPNRVLIAGFDDPVADPEDAIAHSGVWGQLYARSTLFGVYEFVERVMGVRMYFPGPLGTIVPKLECLKVPDMDMFVRPDFLDRSVATYLDGVWFENATTNRHSNWPEKTLQSYRLRMQTDMKPCCHGTTYLKYSERFGKSHPEYFAALPDKTGKLDRALGCARRHYCWTSGIKDEIYRDARSYLIGEEPAVRGVPCWERAGEKMWPANCRGRKYVDIMPHDGFEPCQCPNCKAAYKVGDDNYASELVWGAVAEIGKRLKAEGVSGRLVMMAYRPYRRVPALDLPDNVDVMIGEAGPWSVANPVRFEAEEDEIRSWVEKLGHKVWCWNYPCKWGKIAMPDIPQLAMRAYAAYYRRMMPYITGAFAETQSDRALYNYLNYYVFSKICWNNTVDVEQILAEHHRLMFGAAASEMAEFYEILERLWTERIGGRTIDTPIGPVGAPPSDYEMWYRIYDPDVIARLDGLLSRAAGMVEADSLESRRIALIRREFFERMAMRARAYVESTDVKKALARRRTGDVPSIVNPCEWGVRRVPGLSRDPNHRLVWSAALKLTTTNETGVGGYQKLAGPDPLKDRLLPNARYRVSYFVRTENVVAYSKWGGVALNVWSDQNHFFPADNWFSGTQDWIFQSYEFVTGPKTNERKSDPARIMPRLVNCSGTAWFDDIRLELVNLSWGGRLRTFVSSVDGTVQPMGWYDPGKKDPVPLVIALHSWGADCFSLTPAKTVADYCAKHGWAMLYPNFRGPNVRSEACGSDRAVQDILDAIDWAKRECNIDKDRIYIIGGSGGGHMTLLMAGRHPEVFAGAAAFCPITDLARWQNDSTERKNHYARNLVSVCGGLPAERPDEYARRSPLTWLPRARKADLPVYIATGIHDGHVGSVPVGHAIRAFNVLSDEKDRICAQDLDFIEANEAVPDRLKFEGQDPFYGVKKRVHLQRTSATVRLTIFEGGHEGNYPAGLDFLARQCQGRPVDFSRPESLENVCVEKIAR